jgi:RNA polymerase sigma factor (sigma-70 family)
MDIVRQADRDLLAASRGDPDAFRDFYRATAETVVRYFGARVRDPEVAADLMAETFAAALLAVRGYRPRRDGSALAWLFAIAHNKLVDSARRHKVAAEARERLALDRLVLEDADIARVEELTDLERRSPRLLELVSELPADQRDALLARVVDQRDYPEIATEMRCSESVIRKRVSRALHTLRGQTIGHET